MAPRIKKSSSGVFIVLFLVGFMVVINFQHIKRFAYKIGSDFFYPFIETPSLIKNKVTTGSLITKSKEELAAKADRYKKENDKLLAELTSIDELKREVKTLRSFLEIEDRPKYNYIFSEVLSRDPAFWLERFTISKGSSDGIVPGSPVLSRLETNGPSNKKLSVVGRVLDTTNHTAVVTTIFSKDCQLSVKLPESGVLGILNGGGREGKRLWANINYLPRNIDYKAGEEVYTSGASKWTPSSLYVGKIAGNKLAGEDTPYIKEQNNLFIEAQMEPASNIEDLNFVMIMVRAKE